MQYLVLRVTLETNLVAEKMRRTAVRGPLTLTTALVGPPILARNNRYVSTSLLVALELIRGQSVQLIM